MLYAMWKVASSSPGLYEFFGSDISELKKSQEQINKLAYFDQLTELPNRISLENHLAESIVVENTKFAFIHIDIDNFKHVNDTFDHYFGNKIIIGIAERILKLNENMADERIKLFRIAGDEFGIIYHDFEDYGEVGDYANFVYNEICSEYYSDNIKLLVTVSMGISIYPDYALSFLEVFKTAEIAMVKAKEFGKARTIFFNQDMKHDLEKMVYMTSDIEEALMKNEFALYYQPQYDIQTGEIYGYEALMRWISPKRGLVLPREFIPYAERSGLINKMGLWSLEEAAKFSNELAKSGHGDLKVSVNISATQILDIDFVANILEVIDKTKTNVDNFFLEISEAVVMDSIDTSRIKLEQLNERGVRIALDNFGRRYSSFTHLKKLPVDTIKIDKYFMDSILRTDNFADQQIIMAIINFAKTINIKIIAEGVEEEVQWDWLKGKGCDFCQGYYTGRPLPKAEAIQRLGR